MCLHPHAPISLEPRLTTQIEAWHINVSVEVWLFVAGLVLVAYVYSRWCHSYWSSRGIRTPPFLPFLGHMHKKLPIFQSRWDYYDEVYHKYGGASLCGLYDLFRPVLMIGDPVLVKGILVKDFEHFVDREIFRAEEGSITNETLTRKSGDEWKALRAIMTPTFTSGKIRGMFPLVCNKADTLVSFTLKKAAQKPYVDMKDNFGRFTMDSIASCAFGIECNSFKNEEPEFAKWAAAFFEFSFAKFIKFTLFNMYPRICNALGFKIESNSVKFFTRVVKEIIAARKSGQRREDYLDILLDAQSSLISPTTVPENHTSITHVPSVTEKQVLTDETIMAQCVLFFAAGYDTMASTLAVLSFLLAKHPMHQQRLRQELQQIIQEEGDITYQSIMDAKFLNACVMESLRLYPPAASGERFCTKTYKIPGTKVILHPGDIVIIPFWSLHRDSRYWSEPEMFHPDRFMPENKGKIISYTHMPFGMGPRNCIAKRFALMEAKVALAKLLLRAELHLRSNQQELKLEKISLILRPAAVDLVITPLTTTTTF
ncbi:cytochrome P450 3A21-like isoform X2 [Cherax quadricarinatus]|uniref:cytochrome P450 3A21-like isoform X2 n=1 Tax=Cherax quadricarinatus TaxID=27406 RepID=UPI00387EB7F5